MKSRPRTTFGKRQPELHSKYRGTLFDFGQNEENPFKIPDDEKIFTFKDEEKEKRALQKQINSRLKIWEKNKPIRTGKLRQICNANIELSEVLISEKIQKQKKQEGMGWAASQKSKPKRENRYKLIQRKREMFLVV